MGTQINWLSTTPGSRLENVDDTNPFPVKLTDTPELKTFSYLALGAADALGVVVSAIAGSRLVGWSFSNHKTTELLVRVYDLARKPVAATDNLSIKLRLAMDASAAGTTSNVMLPAPGALFPVGIGFTITTGMTSDVDATAPAAGDAALNFFYV